MKPTTPTRTLRPCTDIQRRRLLTAGLALPLVACGGGGGGGGDGGGGGGGGGAGKPSGRIVTKDSKLWVVDGATGSASNFTATSSNTQPGVGVSRNGSIADVWGYTGGSAGWQLTVRNLAGDVTGNYNISNTLLSFPNSAVVLNADATRLAYSVNEMSSASNSTRIDRTYIYAFPSLTFLGALDNRAEPAFADTGELLARNGATLHAYNSAFADQGPLSITVEQRFGAYSVSPDGRYIAFEDSSRIRVLDRNTGSTWYATDLSPRGHYAPVFSPDGQWIAFLRAGTLALRYLHAIPFAAGVTRTVDDSHAVKSASGELYDGTGRIGWAR